ncbi:MAG: LacI family DNA-binding transcriptional regulator [Candidatus Saccharicenans sp.]|nr:LacI family DNA-binding transcriptional regulator [Candidatus Saccharicenans sp.]
MARKARVSIGTVDRVLHSRGRVHPETEKRVRRVLKELNYRTNVFAKHLKMGRTFNFSVLMPKPQQDSYYWSLPYRGIRKAQEELLSHKVRVNFFFFDRFDEKSVLNTGRRLLRNNSDGLLTAPVLPEGFSRFLNDLSPELPVVFFDSYLPGIKPLAFIGQDAFRSGLLASRLMRQTVHRPSGLVAVIKILPEDYHIAGRIEGFLQGSRDWSGLRPQTLDLVGSWSAADTARYLESFYRRHRDLAGIFVTNAMTHKVAEWWKSNSEKEKIILIGYDPIPRNIALLKAGAIDFLISQQSERQGYEGIYALFRKVVLGEEVKSKIMTQIDIITVDNVDYYQS